MHLEEFAETEKSTPSVMFGDWVGSSDQGLGRGRPLLK